MQAANGALLDSTMQGAQSQAAALPGSCRPCQHAPGLCMLAYKSLLSYHHIWQIHIDPTGLQEMCCQLQHTYAYVQLLLIALARQAHGERFRRLSQVCLTLNDTTPRA